MPDWMVYLTEGKLAIDLLKGARDLIRDALPKGEKSEKTKQEIDTKIQETERAFKASQAELAKELGYRLCRCEFPPNVMLWNKDTRINVCPACGDVWPKKPDIQPLKSGCKRRSNNPSLKQPGIPVAPE
jgi:hypothetical protein